MMINIRVIILVLAISVVVEAQSNFIFNIISYLFGPFLNFAIQRTCRAIFSNFDDGFRLGCRCRGIYEDIRSGIGGKITCQIDDPFCLINRPFKVYCGEVSVTASFNTREGIGSINACIDITSDFPKNFPIPIDDVSKFPKACVSAVPTNTDFLKFESCEIKFDKQVCSQCIVCESQRDFLFNCQNVNVNPAQDVDPLFIEGPFVTECVGFGFLFGSTTEAPTLAPGAPQVAPLFVPLPVPPPIPVAPVAVPVKAPTNLTPTTAPVVPIPVPTPVIAPVPVTTPTNVAPVPVPAPTPAIAPVPVTTPTNVAPVPAPVPTNATAPVPVPVPTNVTVPVPVPVPTNATSPTAP
jgi:hypothetical protein